MVNQDLPNGMPTMIATLTMNPAVDKSCSVETMAAEDKLRCSRPRYDPGGGGINVARVVRRFGAESVAVFPSGGPSGQVLRERLAEEGVQVKEVPTRGWLRENLVVKEESSGHQYRFNMPGPELAEAEIQACLSEVENAAEESSYVVASGSLPPGAPDDTYARLAHLAREAGFRLILDTRGEPLRAAVEEGVFLIKPNLRELRELAGAEIESEAEQEKHVSRLIEEVRCEAVVLSLGAAGVLFASKDHSERIPSPSVPIRSKVGAGDSTVGSLVYALSEGWELREAVRFGVAGGAAAVMTPGTELCRQEDTERLYEQMR